jgi:sec-independent protein translocase protein TatA
MENPLAMIGGMELIVILLVVLLLFGGKKLPELAKSLGKGIREFKQASQGIADELEREVPPKNGENIVVPTSDDNTEEEKLMSTKK